jgi:hypothetical protein
MLKQQLLRLSLWSAKVGSLVAGTSFMEWMINQLINKNAWHNMSHGDLFS